MQKPQLSVKQMITLNLGFFGIQFGWALQWANMSGIYKFLGVDIAQMAYLWIAAPLSGMIIQPIIGQLSDRTWFKLSRRRPYILAGAILASVSLVFMPNSTSLFMATFLLWMLDGSINMAMQPYRALAVDLSPENQITKCFAIQTCLVGIGSTLASVLPWIFTHIPALENAQSGNAVPLTIRLAFYIGSAILLLTNLITTMLTKELPLNAEQMQNIRNKNKTPMLTSLKENLIEMYQSAIKMPKIMREVSFVQVFSWAGMFCVFLYFGIGVAQNVFGLPADADVTNNLTHHKMLENGIALGGLCFGIYTAVSVVYAFLIPYITKAITRKGTHILLLTLGAIGLIGAANFAHTEGQLFLCMIAFGGAWASIVTVPYAILGRWLPKERMGFYMGLLNITICIPQIIVSLILGSVVKNFFHYYAMPVIQLAGILLLLAAFFTLFINDSKDQ